MACNSRHPLLPPAKQGKPTPSATVSARCQVSGASRFPAGFSPAPVSRSPFRVHLRTVTAGYSRRASATVQRGPIRGGPGEVPGCYAHCGKGKAVEFHLALKVPEVRGTLEARPLSRYIFVIAHPVPQLSARSGGVEAHNLRRRFHSYTTRKATASHD